MHTIIVILLADKPKCVWTVTTIPKAPNCEIHLCCRVEILDPIPEGTIIKIGFPGNFFYNNSNHIYIYVIINSYKTHFDIVFNKKK